MRSQSGATLIEILVVSGVLVPVILAAATGLLTTVKLSSSTSETQNLEAAATAYAETLKEIPYVPCADASDYDGHAELWIPSASSGIAVSPVEVSYWSQASRTYEVGPCTSDGGSQLISVRAELPERVSVIEVVKRNPTASATPAATP